MNRILCPYITNGLMISPEAEYRPCCRFDNSKYKRQFQIKQLSHLSATMEDDFLVDQRRLMNNGQWPLGCHSCKKEEEAGLPSLRTKVQKEEAFSGLSTTKDGLLHFFEIGVSRSCNLKCIICSSQFSVLWEEDEKKLNSLKGYSDRNKSFDLETIPKNILQNIRVLKITGGEPLLKKDLTTFIKYFVDNDLAKNMELWIISNATIKPSDELLALIPHFKLFSIALSLDGFEDVNEYTRFPSNWRSIVRNCYYWNDKIIGLKNCELAFSVTVSILTLTSLPRLINFIMKEFNHSYIFLVFLKHPDLLSLDSYGAYKKMIEIKLSTIIEKENIHFTGRFKSYWERILKKIKGLDERTDSKTQLMNYLDKLDEIRNIKERPELII